MKIKKGGFVYDTIRVFVSLSEYGVGTERVFTTSTSTV